MEDGFEGLGEDRKQALKEALKKEWISSPVYKLPERKVKVSRMRGVASKRWRTNARPPKLARPNRKIINKQTGLRFFSGDRARRPKALVFLRHR